MSIQKLIIGNQEIKTEAQRRKILLGGYLIFIYFGIALFFFVVSLFNPEGDPTSLFIGSFFSIVCLILLRNGWIDTALFIHFARANYLAYYFSVTDESTLLTGTYIYFVAASLGALAVYGYTERWKGIGFATVSFVLFLMALLEPENFRVDHAHFYFVLNFAVVFIIGTLILLFFDKMVVTAEKEILKKNSELTKANQELDRFVYSASHDLRAPLTSVLGLITISKIANNEADIKNYLQLMEGRVQHLDKFIHEIIDYSRNTRLELELSDVDLTKLIDEVLQSLEFSDGAKEITIEKSIPANCHLMTDASRLRVVLSNLISNAIRYTDFNKPSSLISIEVVQQTAVTKIMVKDNGQGIGSEHHARIYDMFYKASHNSKGSGLGLYIVKETLGRLGGSVELKSELGKGSTFTIILPHRVR